MVSPVSFVEISDLGADGGVAGQFLSTLVRLAQTGVQGPAAAAGNSLTCIGDHSERYGIDGHFHSLHFAARLTRWKPQRMGLVGASADPLSLM